MRYRNGRMRVVFLLLSAPMRLGVLLRILAGRLAVKFFPQ